MATAVTETSAPAGEYLLAPIGIIQVDQGFNNRRALGNIDELTNSIQSVGVLQPLLVWKRPVNGAATEPKGYLHVIAGHRRLAASLQAGLTHVPVIVVEQDEKARLESLLVENLHRLDIDPLEEADGYKRLLAFGLKQQDIAAKVGRSPAHVSKRLSLLELPVHVQKALGAGTINMGHAQELTKLLAMPARLDSAVAHITKNRWDAPQAVQHELEEQKEAERIGKLKERIKAEGLKLVEIPQYGYSPKGCAKVGDSWDGVPLTVAAHKKFSCHRVTLPRYEKADLDHWCADPTSHPEYVAQQKKNGRAPDPKRGSAAAASKVRNKLIVAAKGGRYDALKKMVGALRPEVSNRAHDEIRELVLRQRLEFCIERKGYQCDLAKNLLGVNFRSWAVTVDPAIALWILELVEMQQLTENTAAIAGAYLDSTELVPQRLAAFYRWIQKKGYKLQEGDVATITHLAKRNRQLAGLVPAKGKKEKS